MSRLRLLFIGASVLGSGACTAKSSVTQAVPAIELLQPDGTAIDHPAAIITQAQLDLEFARKRFARRGDLRAKNLPAKLKQHTIDSLINRRLLVMEADRLKVHASTSAVAREMAALREARDEQGFDRVLIDTYQTAEELENAVSEGLTAIEVLKHAVRDAVKVSDEDVKKRFEALSEEERIRPERVHARQIMVTTEDEATDIHKKLLWKPELFAELATEKSTAPEARRGGDVGWFARGQMPTVFDELCFPLEAMQISSVMASPLGYHICQVLEREPARPMTLDEARPRLAREIRVDAEREAKDAYLENLRSKVKIRFNDDAATPGE